MIQHLLLHPQILIGISKPTTKEMVEVIPRSASAEYKTGESKSQQTSRTTQKGKLRGMSTLH